MGRGGVALPGRRRERVCVVSIGCSQSVRFVECGEGETLPPYDGHHIAVYTNRFAELYEAADRRGLVYNNPRIPNLTYGTVDDALRHNEFRVLHIVDVRGEGGEGGEADEGDGESAIRGAGGGVGGKGEEMRMVYTLEREIRSLRHPGFAATLRACGGAVD